MEGSLNLAALAPCEQKVDMHPMKDSCLYVPQVAGFRKCSIIGACAEIALRDQGESDPISKMVVETKCNASFMLFQGQALLCFQKFS